MKTILELFRIYGRIDLEGADKANSELDRFEGKGRKATSGLGDFAKGIGKVAAGIGVFTLLRKGVDLVKDSVQGAFQRIDRFEQFERVMVALTGSTDEAARALKMTDDVVLGTAYSLDGAAAAVQSFYQRTEDIDKSVGYVEAFGDAVAFYGSGSQAEFDNVSDAIQKMLTKGKVDMQQLNRLFDSNIDAVGIFAQATGRDMEEVQTALSNGEISAEEFVDTISTAMMEGTNGVTKIKGAAKDLGSSWGTVFTNMRTAVTRGVANIIQSIDEMLENNGLPNMRDMVAEFGVKFEGVLNKVADFMPVVADKIDWFKDKLQEWQPTIEKVKGYFEPFVERIRGSFDELKGSVGPIWEDLKGLFESLQPVLELVGAAILIMYGIWLSVSSGITSAIGPVINAVINLVDFVVNMVNVIVALLMGDFAGAWEYWQDAAQSAFDFFVNLLTGIWNFVSDFVMTIIDYFHGLYMTLVGNSIIPDMVNAIVEWFQNMFGWLIDIVSDIVNGVVEFFQKLKSNVERIFSAVGKFISTTWNFIKDTFKNVISFLVGLVTGDFTKMKNAIQSQMKNSQKLLSGIWSAIKTLIGQKAAQILSDIISKFTNIKNNMQQKIESARAAVVQKFANIVSGVTQKAQQVVNAVRTKFNDAKAKIINPIESAKNKISGIVDSIKGFFSNMKLKIPKISLPKMPKFSLKGNFSLKPPSVPKIGVNWNAEGGIFRRPTIFNTANAGLQGVGEAGAEAILPLNKNVLADIGRGIAETMGSQGDENGTHKIERLLYELIRAVKDGKIIKVNERVLGEINDAEQGRRIGVHGRRVAY